MSDTNGATIWGRWVPVEERLPKPDDWHDHETGMVEKMAIVLAYDQEFGFSVSHAQFDERGVFKGWMGDNGEQLNYVTHWTPLPPFPGR